MLATAIGLRNGGKFPFDKVYRIVDGREMMDSHERFAMPFWGSYLQQEGHPDRPRGSEAENHSNRSLRGDDAEKVARLRPLNGGPFDDPMCHGL